MKKLNIIVTIVIILSVLAVIIPFIVIFSGSSISHDSRNWQALGAYFSGMISPVLAILNIFILIKINSNISTFNLKEFDKNHKEKVQNNNEEELSLKLSDTLTVKSSTDRLNYSIDQIIKTFQLLEKSNKLIDTDIRTIIYKIGANEEKYNQIPYYENPFVNRDWEILNIRSNNVIMMLQIRILELIISIYREIIDDGYQDAYFTKKLMETEKELMDLSGKTKIAD